MTRILHAWLGRTDLELSRTAAELEGPTASVLKARPFDALVLLSNYPPNDGKAYSNWLSLHGSPKIYLRQEELSDPTDFAAIHDAVVKAIDFSRRTFGHDIGLS